MKRKKPGEKTKPFIRRKLKPELSHLGAAIAAWVSTHERDIRQTYESLPDEAFEDRSGENFAPLEAILTVADPSRLPEFRQIRSNFTNANNADLGEDATGVRLLSDIKVVFSEKGVEELSSVELAESLTAVETSPWGEKLQDKRGNPSTARLANLLKPFGIIPDRIGGKASQARGYAISWFQDAFDRYLPCQGVNPSTGPEHGGDGEDFRASTGNAVDTSKNAVLPSKYAAGGRVDGLKGEMDGNEVVMQVEKAIVEWEA
jgi:hypothetical protein